MRAPPSKRLLRPPPGPLADALAAAVAVVALGAGPACTDATNAGRPIIDATDTVLVPPDVLFPQDSDAAPDTADTADTAPLPDTADDTQPPPTDVAPDTATAPDVADTSIPVDTSGCPEGLGCDDHDLCTVNDHCEGGRCVGGGSVCDDDLPCTLDTCTNGLCDHDLQAGACVIDGICWTSAQPNPEDACQRCDPGTDPLDWSTIAGCGLGEPCTYHTDCYPERMCAFWSSTGSTACSDPCAGADDCPTGQICTKLPGSTQIGYCQPVVGGLLDDGAACSEGYQCRSGICEGTCAALCLDEAHCNTPGHTCHPVGDLAAGFVMSVCSPDPAGSIGLGKVCSPDGVNFDGSVCASGHCDLTLFPEPNLPCAPICKSETDCAPAQECNLVLYATKANPDAVPFDPQFTTGTRDTLSACYNPGQFGPKGVGAPCTDRSQCSSNKCFALSPGDPTQYCTSFCEFDQECPSGMLCKMDALNLSSTWLATYPTISSQPQVQGAYTFVRVCKFE